MALTPEDYAEFIRPVQEAIERFCDAGASPQEIAACFGGSLRRSLRPASPKVREQCVELFKTSLTPERD